MIYVRNNFFFIILFTLVNLITKDNVLYSDLHYFFSINANGFNTETLIRISMLWLTVMSGILSRQGTSSKKCTKSYVLFIFISLILFSPNNFNK